MTILLSVLIFSTIVIASNEMEITVALTVPDTAWVISIDEVRKVNNEIWVISKVSKNPDVMGAQVISTIEASAVIDPVDLPVRHFIIGKTWDWENEEPYTFIKSIEKLESNLKDSELLYKK
jgi:hypothetical protein